jgi:hypothetical protein
MYNHKVIKKTCVFPHYVLNLNSRWGMFRLPRAIFADDEAWQKILTRDFAKNNKPLIFSDEHCEKQT